MRKLYRLLLQRKAIADIISTRHELITYVDISLGGDLAKDIPTLTAIARDDQLLWTGPGHRNVVTSLCHEQATFIGVELVGAILQIDHRTEIGCGPAVSLEDGGNESTICRLHTRNQGVAACTTGAH